MSVKFRRFTDFDAIPRGRRLVLIVWLFVGIVVTLLVAAVYSVELLSAGRAFVALLACGAEKLSARRFAEYLSLGQVPDPTGEGAPPPSIPAADRWVAPDEELSKIRTVGDLRDTLQRLLPGSSVAA